MKLLEEVLLMTETPTQVKPLPPIWRVPDELWEIIEPILEKHDPPKSTGRPRIGRREALDAIIFRMRSGCQWNSLPKEFPDDSSVHRTFQRWQQRGLFERIWAALASECDELGLLDWQWQAADAAMGKARSGGEQIGRNPTDRGKNGSKRSILVEGSGGPLA